MTELNTRLLSSGYKIFVIKVDEEGTSYKGVYVSVVIQIKRPLEVTLFIWLFLLQQTASLNDRSLLKPNF